MRKSIRTKMLAWLAVLIGVLAGIGVGAVTIGQHEVRNAGAVVQGLDGQMLPSMALLQFAKDIRYNVVQVQQFLTDASATRVPATVEDDFKEAAKQAEVLHRQCKPLLELARTLHQGEAERVLQEARTRFPAYYKTGQVMARSYVADGTAAGDKLMEQFDPQWTRSTT